MSHALRILGITGLQVERDKVFSRATLTPYAQESVLEATASQECFELLLELSAIFWLLKKDN